MVQTTPSPFDVGRAFVHQYYTLLHQAPAMLHRFYSTESTFIHGGVDRPGSMERPAFGPDEIARRINELNLRDCHAKIRQVDSHPTIGNGVVVQVTGELSNDGQPMRRFMQTFVLAPRQPKKYYVQNDIFRYQDEVFDDGSEEDDRSSSQIYGDTDKVSNADSSAAVVVQQPLLVTATTRNAPETEDHEQPKPLPPRETTTQTQVVSTQAVQQQSPQQETPLNGLNETTGFNGQQDVVPESQQLKQTTTENTSYAGIAKLQPSSGPTTATTVPVAGPAVVTVPATVVPNRQPPPKSAPTRSSNPPRGGSAYYSQNHRMNAPGSSQTHRPSPYTSAAPNEQQVFVGSLPADFTKEDLIDCFSQYGKIIEAKIQMPANDNRKNFGFVTFDDKNDAAKVVKEEHITYKTFRLNVEPKTQKGSYGNASNGPQGSGRNSYGSNRGGGGGRGGNRGPYRGAPGSRRNGGGQQHGNNPSSFGGRDEIYKAQKQAPQPEAQLQQPQ